MRVRLAFVAAAVMLVAAACSGQVSPTTGSVSFLTFGDPAEIAAYRDLIAAYTKDHPGADIRLIEANDRKDLLARLGTGFGGGSPPDTFLVNYRFFGQFAAKGVLEPVDARLASSSKIDRDDLYPVATEAFQHQGTLTCLPQNASSLVVYYNKALFAASGVAEPKPGWTFEDMLVAAGELTKDTNGDKLNDQYGLGLDPNLIRLAPFVWSAGGEVVDNEHQPTRIAMDSTAALNAVQQFLQVGSTVKVVPPEQETESLSNEDRFQSGRLGMLVQSRREVPTFRTITAFDWDVAELPRVGKPANILHSDAFCIAKASKAKAAAWSFVEYAVSPPGQRILARAGRIVPVLKSVAESPDFLVAGAKPANARVWIDNIAISRRVPHVATWPEIEDAANKVIEVGFYDETEASVAVAKIKADTASAFTRAGRS